MAKSKKKDKKPNTEQPRSGNCRPFRSVFFFVLAVLILVALKHFHPDQVAENTTDPDQNPVGKFGVQIGYQSFKILGGAGWLLVIASFYLSYMYMLRARRLNWIKFASLFFCIIASASLLSMQERFFVDGFEAVDETEAEMHPPKFPAGPGGIVGTLIYGTSENSPSEDFDSTGSEAVFTGFLHDNLGTFGSALVLGIILLTSLTLLLTGNLTDALQKFSTGFADWKKERETEKTARQE